MEKATDTNSAAHQAYLFIKERLISGAFPPGMRLTEDQLARDLGTSRTPVREAIRQLTTEGFLNQRPNFGTFASSWSIDQIREVFDLRAVIEAKVAALAAVRITDEALETLKRLQRELESAGPNQSFENLNRIGRINREIHGVIADASGNQRLVGILTKSIEMPITQKTFQRYTTAQLERSFRQHWELFDAFEARDPDWAYHVMSCHIFSAKHALLDKLEVLRLDEAGDEQAKTIGTAG